MPNIYFLLFLIILSLYFKIPLYLLSILANILSNVDLPLPDGPNITVIPFSIFRLTFIRPNVLSLYFLLIFINSYITSLLLLYTSYNQKILKKIIDVSIRYFF